MSKDNVTNIFPADDFKTVAKNASENIQMGLIIGYDKEGDILVYGGGLNHQGFRPNQGQWLWLIETFKNNLINGVYQDE